MASVVAMNADMQSWGKPEKPWMVWPTMLLALTMLLLCIRRYVILSVPVRQPWVNASLNAAVAVPITGILFAVWSALVRYLYH